MKNAFLKIIAILTAIFLLAGCCPSQQEAKALNAVGLSSPGELVGKLPDGREVFRWSVYGPETQYTHHIYVVGDAGSVTMNNVYRSGKVTHHVVNAVIINGKEYIKKKH